MVSDEQLMSQRESLLNNKYKYDGCFIFCEGSFYGEGLNEEHAKNMCKALNEMIEKHENERKITLGDVKYFLSLLSDLIEVKQPKTRKIVIGSDKPDMKRIKRTIKKSLDKIKGKKI